MRPATFVFLSTTDWDAPQFGSRQQIARRLVTRGHRVFFVEVPRAPHSFISDPAGTCRVLQRLGRIRQISGGPVVYTPLPVLPVYYNPLVNALNQRLLCRYLRQALARLGWPIDVLWTYWPHTAYLIDQLQKRIAVYHCIDDFVAARYPLVTVDSIARMEARQCRQVDLIFARTEGLTAAKRRFNPRTYFLPGGVDTVLFNPAQVTEPLTDLAPLASPRVGLAGTLDDRLDVKLLMHCAQRLTRVSFVLVGPVKRHRVHLGLLTRLPNVHLLPARAHVNIPAVVAALDVCLIPYRVNAYTEGLSPLKLYEYLAMGKPVVATDLPYLRREATHIHLACTPEAFLAKIQMALADPPSKTQQHRWRAVAESYSWEYQVDAIEGRLSSLLESKQSQ